MNIDKPLPGARQFEAEPPFWGSKVASITTPAWKQSPGKSYLIMVIAVLAFAVVLGAAFVGLQSMSADSAKWVQQAVGHGFQFGLLVLLLAGVYGWYWWSRRRKLIVSVTDDGLTVSTRPGEVYPFTGAKLGTWGVTGGATMGTALHLYCGTKRFILGGRDRRVSARTPLQAPDAGYGQAIDVDASLPANEFDEILTMVSRRTGLDVRRPGPDEPVRCLLFTNSLKVQEISSFSVRKQQQFMGSLGQPRLAIEVSPDVIRVHDAVTNNLIASVSPGQVTATPVTFRPMQGYHWFPSAGNLMSDAATNYWSTSPGMRVAIPGVQPLSVGCRDSVSGLDFRFSWTGDIPTEAARADYEVSGTDWLTLAESFGLVSRLNTKGERAQ
ncbi:hypothetical protein [Mycobacterium sp. 3519A]|uniref:hypothetical protein n=1 Tax=Mycobacterium sp. 3519A TaxID=2057184 RepID=UPI000C7DD01F|nr:hypothetical protein [Mycobacterium sp. 3519A]